MQQIVGTLQFATQKFQRLCVPTVAAFAFSAYIFRGMPDKAHDEFHSCPVCQGRGTVPSRLPALTKPCGPVRPP